MPHRPTQPLARCLAIAGLFATAVGCSGPRAGPVEADADPVVSLVTDSRVGVSHGGSSHDAATWNAGLNAAADAGAGWFRVLVRWSRVERSRGVDTWGPTDSLVARVRAAGLKPLIVLSTTPVWASAAPPAVLAETTATCQQPKAQRYPPRNQADWEAFVGRAAARYHGTVAGWQIWNEPDLDGFQDGVRPCAGRSWCGTRSDYAQFLATAARAIRTYSPGTPVVMAGLAYVASADTGFLEAILRDPVNPAAASFDIAAFHFYKPPGELVSTLSGFKARLAAGGAAGREVWITETGHATWSDYWQVTYMRQVVPGLLDNGADRVFWFRLFEPPPDNACPSVAPGYGLHGLDGAPRPALAALRAITTSRLEAANAAAAANTTNTPR